MFDESVRPNRVLITGVGGAAGIASVRASVPAGYEVHVADADYNAPGLYTQGMDHRHVIPKGDHSKFIQSLLEICRSQGIALLLPTVDAELKAIARARDEFARIGTQIVSSGITAIERCLDKWKTVRILSGIIDVPQSSLMSEVDGDRIAQHARAVIKPRCGSGSDGIVFLERGQKAPIEVRNSDYIVQEFLPGLEFSVDVLSSRAGRVLAAVPRERIKVDSGVSVVSRTIPSAHLCELARKAAEGLGVSYVTNVQFRCDAAGRPKLLEVNARVPGTIALTVAAGVNMVALSLSMAAGKDPGLEGRFDQQFRELVVIRQLSEFYVSADEWRKMRSAGKAVEDGAPTPIERASSESLAA